MTVALWTGTFDASFGRWLISNLLSMTFIAAVKKLKNELRTEEIGFAVTNNIAN